MPAASSTSPPSALPTAPDIGASRAARGRRKGGASRPRPRGGGDAGSPAIVPPFASADDAGLAQVQIGEMRVGIRELEPDRAVGLGPAAAHFGCRELEAVRHVEAG